MSLSTISNFWNKSRGFGKMAYPFRFFSNLCAAGLMVLHHVENNLKMSYLEYLTLGMILLLSHVFFIQYVKSGNANKVASSQLIYDFIPLGWWVGIMHLSILPCFIFILSIIVNYISVKGFNKLYRLLLIPLFAIISLASQGFLIQLDNGYWVGVLSLSYGTLHFLIVAFVSFNYASRYQKNQKALKEQKLKIENQRQEILEQAEELKSLNESLQALNNNLESKVNDRALQLRQKNKLLTEYAFINAHKLRAPVASIMGLVQFFDYDDHTSEQEKQIKARLKESSTELEQTIGDIRKKLEGEGLVSPDNSDSSTIDLQKVQINKDDEKTS